MTTSPSHRHGLHPLLGQFILVVGYALACLTLLSLVALSLTALLGWPLLMDPRADRARLDIQNIVLALSLHRLNHGHYPSTEEGLRALVQARALESVPRDPWNAEYHYALREGRPQVWSLGEDGVPGGDGEDGDLYSRPLPP